MVDESVMPAEGSAVISNRSSLELSMTELSAASSGRF